MFMKVYQYPPRRGNGSYWTLLSDGEEELKRAIPLFSTFRPPVIDSESVYSRGVSTHTVKSKGQFVPLLPRSNLSSTNQAYFSVDGTLSTGARIQSEEEITTEVVLDSAHLESEGTGVQGDVHQSSKQLPVHILEHSYAKPSQIPLDNLLDSSIESDKENDECPPTPKRKKTAGKSSSRPPASASFPHTSKGIQVHTEATETDGGGFQTPPKEQDSSLHLLDSSLLTPLRNLGPDVEIGPISLSPLYTNFVTPKRSTDAMHSPPPTAATSSDSTSSVTTSTSGSFCSSSSSYSTGLAPSSSHPHSSNALLLPFTPLRSSSGGTIGGVGGFDSGIFSPLSSDTFNIKFSTPILSPLTDLLQPNTFSTPHPPEFLTPLKVLDSSNGNGSTPLRPGSLQALGLPGFTPPTSALKSHR